jgi:cytochrome c oxidase subunit 5b
MPKRHFSSDSSHQASVPVFGPGLKKKGEIATNLEHLTGLARLEYLASLKGENIFLDDPIKAEKRGTLKEPILVDSLFAYRLVGCTGTKHSDCRCQLLKCLLGMAFHATLLQ